MPVHLASRIPICNKQRTNISISNNNNSSSSSSNLSSLVVGLRAPHPKSTKPASTYLDRMAGHEVVAVMDPQRIRTFSTP